MKFRGHETFYIRKSWLSKGMRNIDADQFAFMGENDNPMDLFGIGSNMVKSLRYWLQATGLTQEPNGGKRYQILTPFGQLVYEYDKYTEEMGTLWLIHYMLAKNIDLCTSWYCFFNEFKFNEFNKDDFVKRVSNFAKMNGEGVAERAYSEDFDCLTKTYIPKSKLDGKDVNPENNIESPLAELNILDVVDRKNKTYKKCVPKKDTIHPLVALAIIVDNAKGANEVTISSIQNDNNNLGKVLNLDIIALTNLLNKIELLGHIKVIRTAGLDVVNIVTELDFLHIVKQYYLNINGLVEN